MVGIPQCYLTGADPGFDQGGPQIMTGLKLPFWGLIFGGQGGPGAPLISAPALYGHGQPHWSWNTIQGYGNTV